MASFAACAAEHTAMAATMQQHASTLRFIAPTPASVSTMTLEFCTDVKPDLPAIAAAVKRKYRLENASKAAADGRVHWRGRGISVPKQFRNVCLRGKAFGDSYCLCLVVGTLASNARPWDEQKAACHAKVFNTGHIKLLGCTDYQMADAAMATLVAIIQHTSGGGGRPVQVVSTSTHLINGVFAMPPFSKDNIIVKKNLNNLARDAGIHVHSGAGDGKPYIKFVLEHGCKALVYMTGKVWITGCRSVADFGSTAMRVQAFVDSHAEQLTIHDEDEDDLTMSEDDDDLMTTSHLV